MSLLFVLAMASLFVIPVLRWLLQKSKEEDLTLGSTQAIRVFEEQVIPKNTAPREKKSSPSPAPKKENSLEDKGVWCDNCQTYHPRVDLAQKNKTDFKPESGINRMGAKLHTPMLDNLDKYGYNAVADTASPIEDALEQDLKKTVERFAAHEQDAMEAMEDLQDNPEASSFIIDTLGVYLEKFFPELGLFETHHVIHQLCELTKQPIVDGETSDTLIFRGRRFVYFEPDAVLLMTDELKKLADSVAKDTNTSIGSVFADSLVLYRQWTSAMSSGRILPLYDAYGTVRHGFLVAHLGDPAYDAQETWQMSETDKLVMEKGMPTRQLHVKEHLH